MIDWYEVARHKEIRRLGEAIRRQLNLWVGFIGPAGLAASIGVQQPVDKPLCDAFMGRRDNDGCNLSVRGWFKELSDTSHMPSGPILLTCHAQLSALAAPVMIEDRVVGGLYASGFVMMDEGEEADHALFQRGRELNIGRATLAHGTRELVRLSQRELRLLGDLLEAMVEEAQLFLGEQQYIDELASEPQGPRSYSNIIGNSPTMMELYRLLDKVVTSDSTVLITGEGGVGKELVARAVHFNSRRAGNAFVVQNCSALNDSLLDSELFGHRKGAFTGAIIDKLGLFELADHGTFFLDEIGDMSPVLQVKLLRVLQEGTFTPVGSTVTRKVDVRIIAATNKDLRKMVKEERFRSDLFYRLNVISVKVPPLRDRLDDVPELVNFFLQRKSAEHHCPHKILSDEALERMVSYTWPGNVRELENEIERLVVLSGDGPIPPSLLSPKLQQAGGQPGLVSISSSQGNLPDALEHLERQMIFDALKRCGWNKTRAAKELGISRRNLIRKVDRYELDKLKPSE